MDKIRIWFTSRNIYDKYYDENSWEKYMKWSRLNQLEELVSLDGILNSVVFEPDFGEEFENIVVEENQMTQFYRSLDYVIKKSSHLNYYNLLAVIKEPDNKRHIRLEDDFDFIGYDLIEVDGNISALVNCGGFDDTFKPRDQNEYGLISDYDRAREIQIELPINYPEEQHADCDLFEVWRHKFIGRNKSFNKEFSEKLEYILGEAFRKSKLEELKGIWCDGVLHQRIDKKM